MLSDRLHFYALHYNRDSGGLVLCYGTVEECPSCQLGYTRLAYGYAAVMSWPSKALYLLALPPSAYSNCPDGAKLKADARGQTLQLTRTVASKRGPIRVEVQGKIASKVPLPLSWNIEADVHRRFGFNVVDLSDVQER